MNSSSTWLETAVVVPLLQSTPSGTLWFIGTTTVFGPPVDIALSALALETLFPADAASARAPRLLVADEAGQAGGQLGSE